ncbi:MAG: RNA polymerase sigma factor [Clostridia bacterium]|nr:RNA polymerase sigma factor [Clostridia bacterium]
MKSNQTAVVDEQELLQRVKVDKQAFLAIYDHHFSQIYNYIFYRTFNQADAEELTSQTFLAALENIDRYEYRNIPILVWLYKIAAHVVVDFYRRQGTTMECEWQETDSLQNNEFSPETAYLHNSEKEQLLRQLQMLPLLQQQALVLRYRHDLSYKEIAEIMEKTEGAIKQLLHRGLKNLRERMVDHE